MVYVLTDTIQQGWQCPVCRHVYSPGVAVCLYCPAEPVTSTGANHQPTVDLIAKGHLGTPCPKPREGGLCGCDEDDLDGPRDCYQGRCSC